MRNVVLASSYVFILKFCVRMGAPTVFLEKWRESLAECHTGTVDDSRHDHGPGAALCKGYMKRPLNKFKKTMYKIRHIRTPLEALLVQIKASAYERRYRGNYPRETSYSALQYNQTKINH